MLQCNARPLGTRLSTRKEELELEEQAVADSLTC